MNITKYFHKNAYFIKLIKRKPRLLPRYIKAAFGMWGHNNYFISATILPSLACNLSCKHCYAETLKKHGKKPMTPEQVETVLKELYNHGIFQFEFQGGEPLLLNELPRYVKACQPNRSIISITTNGVLLNEKKAELLKKLKIDVIHISLDSFIPEEHDAFRGRQGLFNEAMRAMKLARKYGFNHTFQVTVTHKNLHSEGIQRLFDFAIRNKVPLWIFVAQVSGRWSDREELLLTKDDIQYLRKLHDTHPNIINRDLWNWFGNYACPAGKFNVIITPYGEVMPCPFIQVMYGNLLEENIDLIHKRIMEDSYFKNFYDGCLASENKEFMKSYIKPLRYAEQLPAPITELELLRNKMEASNMKDR